MRCGGPTALLLGAAAVAALALQDPAEQSTLAVWLYAYVLTPIRLLGFLGLGIALAMVPRPVAFIAGMAGMAALYAGLSAGQPLWAALEELSAFQLRLSILGPLASLGVGACLIAPAPLRRFLAPFSALVLGLSLGLVIHLTDPYLGAPGPGLWGGGAALWAIASVAITTYAWRRSWFAIATPILGSWLLAIALLTGGAVLLPIFQPHETAFPAPEIGPAPDDNAFGNLFPESGSADGQISGEWQPQRRKDGPQQVLP